MANDNRISATLSEQDASDILAALQTIRAKLPFLLTLSPQERLEMAKMGDKSVGFDAKCVAYMQSNPEFLPRFVEPAEVDKDWALRAQIMRFTAELNALSEQVDDTLMVTSSEVWMADLAYYQSVREAAKRGRAGAQVIFDDLRQRFPGAGAASARAPGKPAAAAAVQAA